MKGKWDKILEQRDCLSVKELEQYTSGLISNDKKLEIEAHLNQCDLCSDAVEGRMLLKSEKKALPWKLVVSIAAAITIVLLIINPFSSSEKKELLAENNKPEAKQQIPTESFENTDNEEFISEQNQTEDDLIKQKEETKEVITIETNSSDDFELTFSDSDRSTANISIESDDFEEEPLESAVIENREMEALSVSETIEEKQATDEEEMLSDLYDDQIIIEVKKEKELIETKKSDERERHQTKMTDSVVYKKSIIPKKLNNGKKTYRRKELKEEEIDYDKLVTDYSGIEETDFEFDSLSPSERDSIGLILDEKQYEYEFSVGKELYDQKDYLKALEHLEKVIGSYGGNAYAIYLTARSYQEIEQYEKANKLFKALYETADVNTREKAFYNSAFCYWKLNNSKKALKILDDMIARNSTLKKEAQELKKLINNG